MSTGPALSVGRAAGLSFAVDGAPYAFLLALKLNIEIARSVSGPGVEFMPNPAGREVVLTLTPLAQNRIGLHVERLHERADTLHGRRAGRHGCHSAPEFVASGL